MRVEFGRKSKNQVNTVTQSLIVLCLLIVLNYLVSFFPMRFDLTENKEYSLTPMTKKSLNLLDDVVNIKAFFTEDLPPRFLKVREDSKDIFREYQNIAGNNLNVLYVDPKDDPEIEQEAASLGIPLLQFTDVEKDKFQVSNGYLGLVITYADRKEVIPIIEDTRNLEYDITLAIRKVTSQETFNIAFTTGHDEWDRTTTLKIATKSLEKQYQVRDIDTTNGELIPDDINTLIIAGPKNDFTEREKYVLDQFLMKGKSIFFILDGVQVTNQLQTTPSDYGLSEILEHYGVKLNSNLILDASNELANFTTGFTTFFTPYPFWIKIIKPGFDQENIIVNKLETLVLPWASSVEVIEEKMENKEYSVLAKSSEKSWLQNENFNLDPQQKFDPESAEFKSSPVAVLLSGKFKSYFHDRDIPSIKEQDKSQVSLSEEVIKETENARIVVIGDSDFIVDGLVSRYQPNNIFFQNATDFLTQDVDLITIRSKGITDRPLKADLSDKEKTSYRYLNIFGPLFLVLLIGGLRFTTRRQVKTIN